MPLESDGYLDDSDFEDEPDDTSYTSGCLTVSSLSDSFKSQEPRTPVKEDDITHPGDTNIMSENEKVHNLFLIFDPWFEH